MRRLKIRNAVILLLLLSACVSFSCRRNPPPVTTGSTPPPPPPPPPPPTPAPTISLTATPATVNAGQAVTLAWQSTNATTVGIQPEIGNVTAIGNRQVTPASSVTYTATANGPGGSATAVARVTVNAAPPPPPPSVPDRPVVTSLSDQFRAQFENQPVLFDYDKSDIRADQVARLQSHANFLKKNASVRISIEGHADERGSQEYNVALGDERAASVMKYLVEQGVAATRMSTVSYGEERPVCRTQDEGCYQQNRRAAFVMVN